MIEFADEAEDLMVGEGGVTRIHGPERAALNYSGHGLLR